MSPSDVQTLVCPNCGAPIHHGDLTCEYCGAALYAGHAAEVTVPALAQAQKVIPKMRERIKANPYDGDAYYQLGLALFTLRFYDQAEEAFELAQRYLPGQALICYFAGLSILYCAEEEILSIPAFRISEMRRQFQQAASLDPSLAEARLYGRFADALLARNEEDYAGAIVPLQEVVQTLPKLELAWRVLAACCFQVGRYSDAVQAGRQALQLRPYNADLAFLIGTAYNRLGDATEVEDWAHRVAEMRGQPDGWEHVVREFKGKIG